jgi:hypothetical protein
MLHLICRSPARPLGRSREGTLTAKLPVPSLICCSATLGCPIALSSASTTASNGFDDVTLIRSTSFVCLSMSRLSLSEQIGYCELCARRAAQSEHRQPTIRAHERQSARTLSRHGDKGNGALSQRAVCPGGNSKSVQPPGRPRFGQILRLRGEPCRLTWATNGGLPWTNSRALSCLCCCWLPSGLAPAAAAAQTDLTLISSGRRWPRRGNDAPAADASTSPGTSLGRNFETECGTR